MRRALGGSVDGVLSEYRIFPKHALVRTPAGYRLRVRADPGWRVVELATGHDAMISAPSLLLSELLALA